MPDGLQVYKKPEYYINFESKLYKEYVSEENLVGKLNGVYNTSKDGIIWTNTYSLEPETSYILYKPEGEFEAYDPVTNSFSNEWYNGEVKIRLNTPSIVESGIPQLELKEPVIGTYQNNGNNTFLRQGDKIDALNSIYFVLKDLKYSYNGEQYASDIMGEHKVEIYDVTKGEPILIKSAIILGEIQETTTFYYTVFRANLNVYFFEGHKYRLVLPAGQITAGPNLIKNYVANSELSVEFEGATPATVELVSCSVADGAQLSEVPCIEWKFKGDFVMNPDLYVTMKTPAGGSALPTFSKTNFNGETLVDAFYCEAGKPMTLRAGTNYSIIFPEGLIYYAGDPNIKNPEYIINITGVAKTPEVIEPEFVNVKITTNDFLVTDQQAVKGKPFTYTVDFEGETPWAVESVKQNGKSLSVVDGTFKTSALTGNTEIDINTAYKGPWAVDETGTGVWEVPNSDIKIYKEMDFIVVEGVTPDNTVNVYNVVGMLINTTHVNGDNDTVRITVAPGQYYIVTVDGVAAKIKM